MAGHGSDRDRHKPARATDSTPDRAPGREARRDADRATDRMIDRARTDVDARIASGREPRSGADTLARAAAETRETDRAREIRDDDDERTAQRQEQLAAMERDGESSLRHSSRTLSRTGEEIADTRAQIREGMSDAQEIERTARELNEGAQRLLDEVRSTMPRTRDDAAQGDAAQGDAARGDEGSAPRDR